MSTRPTLRVVASRAPHNTETSDLPDVFGVRRQVADLATQIAVQQHYLRQLSAALEQLYAALGAMTHKTQGGQVMRPDDLDPWFVLLTDTEPPRWQDDALCAQTDPEAFYPEKGGSTREAKRICQNCPVSAECLEYALAHDERFGVWGGMSERERRKLKKTRAAEVKA